MQSSKTDQTDQQIKIAEFPIGREREGEGAGGGSDWGNQPIGWEGGGQPVEEKKEKLLDGEGIIKGEG